MDTLLKEAINRALDLPQEQQRMIAEALILSEAWQVANMPVIDFTAEENAMIDEGLAAIERGDVIPGEEVFVELRARNDKSSKQSS